MTTLTEGIYATESFISEAPGDRSREAIVVKSGQNLKACAVLATIVSGTVASAAKSGGNTGNGTFTLDGTTPLLLGAKLGVYTLRCTAAAANNGTFRLEDPDGLVLGDIVMAAGAATVAEQIKGALADGSSDFVVGDGFDITVTVATEKEVEYNPAGTDGSQIATGILYGAINATSADTRGVAYKRDCEHNADIVVWKSGITATQKAKGTADLKRRGIILR
ncbi:head decoration protein [Sphingobium sp. DEHP117]|uniref:head decoration protein n=1 Tax=Sphingobium sp. DEHP117 TaxID=2993436 RepID=UPI0027D7038F|nr:head decoration protein [Sphingobium sp. DEHP117]MDQ4421464.1 head decoration protein [Sphingobium sp. DEHP117]